MVTASRPRFVSSHVPPPDERRSPFFLFFLQCQLYQSIKPLFTNKPTFIVINKIDIMRPADLDPARRAMLDAILAEDNVTLLELSCVSDEGVMDVRNAACDALLAHRVESKEKTKRVENVANRVRVSVPVSRDGVKREPFIPAGVATRKAYDKADPERRRLEKDEEEENGGAGAFSVDMKSELPFPSLSQRFTDLVRLQRTTCSRTPSGSTTSSPRSRTARTSPTLSTPTLSPASRSSRPRRTGSRPLGSTTTRTTRCVSPFSFFELAL